MRISAAQYASRTNGIPLRKYSQVVVLHLSLCHISCSAWILSIQCKCKHNFLLFFAWGIVFKTPAVRKEKDRHSQLECWDSSLFVKNKQFWQFCQRWNCDRRSSTTILVCVTTTTVCPYRSSSAVSRPFFFCAIFLYVACYMSTW